MSLKCTSEGALAAVREAVVERPDAAFLKAAVNAAATRAFRAGVSFGLMHADREDLFQEVILDLLERAKRFDPARGVAGTFTGVVSEHRTADFLNELKKDRARLSLFSDGEAANDSEASGESDPRDEIVVSLWAEDRDFFEDSNTLHDVEAALAYMDGEQLALFDLLQAHQDLPGACRASGLSSATFYRRVADLQMHLRMFGFRSAA